MKYLKKFRIFENSTSEIIIDGETYVISKAHIDFDKFDEDGICDEYQDKSYVIIDSWTQDPQPPRVRMLNGIFDNNNHRGSFDPMNYSDDIMVRLEHGDECMEEEMYDIISTTNKSGRVLYDYLMGDADYLSKDGYFIHKDLIS